jgi:hypothetical protein
MESTLATPLEAACEMEIKGEWLKNNTSISSVAEGARFENPPASETIGPNLVQSVQSQSLIEEFEIGEKPIKTDATR